MTAARVLVVGAGLAGLTAADTLHRQGVAVTVLEARDRVGGRTHGVEVAPGSFADAGAAYLGDRHTSLHHLLDRLGLKTTPTTTEGASRFAFPDLTEQSGRFPPLNAVALGDLFDRLDDLTRRVRPEQPWASADAEALDAETAADWAERNLRHPDARRFFPLFLGEMMAADPAAVSVLHMAFYLRSGGGLNYLNAFEGGAQADRVDGGAHQICAHLAAGLDVRLGYQVEAIHADGDRVVVNGDESADAVIVAIPPLLADAIDFRPGLPERRSGTRTAPGSAVKVHLVYPAPLWRAHGLSGWSVSERGPLLSTVDDSPADGSVGVLTGFVTGAEAHRYAALPLVTQRAEATEQAAALFPLLPPPIAVHVTDWVTDPYSRGCYAALFGPGDWLRGGPHLTRPHGRVHWAGTETSTEFFGLMEGAIRSGHRAAAEVLTDLTPIDPTPTDRLEGRDERQSDRAA
ncbi:MAG: NAD(P)-binding protein [Hamadaea sp.]|nr:NAD(P)-binding protein [Hamadaea sp.]